MNDQSLKELLLKDPGDARFPEYAALLMSQSKLDEALFCLMAGLSANPSNHRGRILLARIYYEKGFLPFAVRELEVLQLELPDNKYLRRLLERIAPDRVIHNAQPKASPPPEETLAETDFDFDEIELIDEKN